MFLNYTLGYTSYKIHLTARPWTTLSTYHNRSSRLYSSSSSIFKFESSPFSLISISISLMASVATLASVLAAKTTKAPPAAYKYHGRFTRSLDQRLLFQHCLHRLYQRFLVQNQEVSLFQNCVYPHW